MKAVVVHKCGGPEVLEFDDYPNTVAGAGEMLVRVAAASVNPLDYKRRARLTNDYYPIHFPGLIGVAMARTVVKIGLEDQALATDDNTAVANLPLVDAVADRVDGTKVKPGRVFATVLGAPQNAAKYPAVKVVPVFSKFGRKTHEFMAEAVRDGRLVIPIGETLPLRQADEAQAAAEKGVAGKTLLVA
jgi:NADPH:quinone reductase-like Zn-dependent oxidoreductase